MLPQTAKIATADSSVWITKQILLQYTNMENKSKLFRGNALLISLLSGSMILLVVFIFVATLSGAWPGEGVSAQILSALAGAVVTAIITMFRLLGQTSNEEKKERNAKIFEEKLRIYNEFLQNLCQVVKDMEISKEEEIMLEFQVAQIAMHTSTESINKISEQVSAIITGIKTKDNQTGEMLNELFAIADIFYKELYGKDNDMDDNSRESTIEYFRTILIAKEKIQNQDAIQRQAVINMYKDRSYLNLTDRAKLLKAMIPQNESKQWIWARTTLVHEYFTDIDPTTNSYISSKNQIAIDLFPNSDKKIYRITIFLRTMNLEGIQKIAKEIWPDKEFKPYPSNEPCRLTYKKFDFSASNEEIAQTMIELLNDIKNYRDKTYPLK